MNKRYAIGIDFGTLSGRAVVVDVENGEEKSTSVCAYSHGVMDEILCDGITKLPKQTALQHPADYIEVLKKTIPEALKKANVSNEQIVGIGIDFTSCSVLPIYADGTPLCFDEKYKNRIHAYVKLWKHHSAQYEADKFEKIANSRNECFMKYYGGKMSSEYLFPKIMQVLDEDEEIYNAADKFIECGDWVVMQLTGNERRSLCQSAFKASWSKQNGYPSKDFFAALDKRLENVVDEKLSADIYSPHRCAGYLTEKAAEITGLKKGTPVSIANIDAHSALPASGVTNPGDMLMIIGTSTCHIIMSEQEKFISGINGVAEDAVVPGYYAYEAGQAGVGDIFEWFVKNSLPYSYYLEAKQNNKEIYRLLQEKAELLKPGENGIIALDWFNGNRSILTDADLSGMILGYTLRTKPEEIYRALMEATGFGTRMIIETFETNGVKINKLYASGGTAKKDSLMMQIYADITKKEIHIVKAEQPCALGAALSGAVAAGKSRGGYDSIKEAAAKMSGHSEKVYYPIKENSIIYDKLFDEYKTLHNYFGRGENNVMKKLLNQNNNDK